MNKNNPVTKTDRNRNTYIKLKILSKSKFTYKSGVISDTALEPGGFNFMCLPIFRTFKPLVNIISKDYFDQN